MRVVTAVFVVLYSIAASIRSKGAENRAVGVLALSLAFNTLSIAMLLTPSLVTTESHVPELVAVLVFVASYSACWQLLVRSGRWRGLLERYGSADAAYRASCRAIGWSYVSLTGLLLLSSLVMTFEPQG